MSVELELEGEGRPILLVALAGKVAVGDAKKAAGAAAIEVERLEGRPFALLFDLRRVTEFADEAAPVLQQIEVSAAARGLEVVAHLVAQDELATRADAALKGTPVEKVIRSFTDEKAARAFASGIASGS